MEREMERERKIDLILNHFFFRRKNKKCTLTLFGGCCCLFSILYPNGKLKNVYLMFMKRRRKVEEKKEDGIGIEKM
jgi:hypothetical protein